MATGLGLPAPAPAPSRSRTDPAPSPALSQLGGTWPLDGGVIGIVADADSDLKGVRAVRDAVLKAGMVPLVIAPTGGTLGTGRNPVTVQRTFAATRSTEFDALLLAGGPGAAADARGARDSKAADPDPGGPDPRVLLLLAEAHRHGKAIGGWNDSARVLQAAGIQEDDAGTAFASSPAAALKGITQGLREHRAWDRFPTSL